jgi:hypothetical protein
VAIKLYGCTSPNGRLYEWDSVSSWINRITLIAETSINSLTVFNSKLYGGTSPNGNLLEWDGLSVWIQRAAQLNGQTDVLSLAVYNGKVYGSTSPGGRLFEWTTGAASWTERAPQLGSETAITELVVDTTANKLDGGTGPDGCLYQWDTVSAWVLKAGFSSDTSINSLTVFNSKLYGGTSPNGKLLEWNGANTWIQDAPQLGSETSINSLVVFNPGSGNKLYGGSSPGGRLFEWNDIDAWVEKAPQLGSETGINSLTVFDSGLGGRLYGGSSPGGRLFEWNNANAWTERAPQLGSETSIYSLTVFNPGSGNKLYGSTGPSGSLLEWDSVNHWTQRVSSSLIQSMTTFNGNIYCGTSTGRLFVWNSAASRWDMKADTLGSSSTIGALTVFNGKIYGGASDGRLLEWNGVNIWTQKAPQFSGQSIVSLTVFNSKLYAGTSPNGCLFEWDGTNAWTQRAGQLKSQTSINCLAVFNSKLYGGTYASSNGGHLFEWNGVNAWTERAPQSGTETAINALAVFNNKLYGSTSFGGRLLEWNSTNNVWIGKTYILGSETSILSLAVFNGKLYGGTSPNGLLYEWDGATKWVKMASSSGQVAIPDLALFNNKLYGVTQSGGNLLEYSDSGSRIVPNFFTGYSNTWLHVVIVANYAAHRVDFYRNGLIAGSLTSSMITQTFKPKYGPKYVGAYVVAGTAVNPYSGGIDELRISQANQDPNWIKLSYNNELNPGDFITVSPNESIFFRVNAAVTAKNGPVSDATVSGTLIYCIPGVTTPSYSQLQSQAATTDSAGVTTLDFRGYTSTIGVYFILVRANHAGVENVGYYMSSPLPKPDPVGVFVTTYENGTLTLVHRKDIDIHYPYSDVVGYNTTFAMPVGVDSYRSVSLDSAGQISPGNPGMVQLGAAKDNPGVLLTFLKTASNTYGLTFTPWGVSSLNLQATFGAPIMDATNVITKTRMINIESYTYEVKVQIWKIGK